MKRIALASLCMAAFLPALGSAQAQDGVADMVIVNANVFTASEANPRAEAIAIKGDRILAVSTNQKIESLVGPKTKRIDAAGRLVIPGIMDTHIHYAKGGPTPTNVLPTVTFLDFGDRSPSCKQVLQRVSQKVPEVPKGNLLFGFMGSDAFFEEQCTPAALDKIAPNTAVLLGAGSVHAGMLNKAAEKWFGVDTSLPPSLAGWYGKDTKSKTWDGVVHNSAMLPLLMRTMTDESKDDEALRRYFTDEAKWGVTSNTFMEYDPAARVAQLARVDAPFRVWVMPFAQFETGQHRRRLQQVTVPEKIADRVTSRGEKWVLDGTPLERSAPLLVPYADDPSASGRLDYPDAEVRAILNEALQHKLPLMLHATGDRTVKQLFDAMDATGGEKVWAKQRVRIEHGDGLTGEELPRARKLGVIIAENPNHVLGDVGVKRFGPERASKFLLFKSLLDAHVPLVLAADGSPGNPFNNPFLDIQIATNDPLNPKESLTREQALIAYTRTAAYSEFTEARLGTLEPGKLADLAMLSQDIFKAPTDELPKTESVLTVVGGKIAYSRDHLQ